MHSNTLEHCGSRLMNIFDNMNWSRNENMKIYDVGYEPRETLSIRKQANCFNALHWVEQGDEKNVLYES